MLDVSPEEFDELVADALDQIPPDVRQAFLAEAE